MAMEEKAARIEIGKSEIVGVFSKTHSLTEMFKQFFSICFPVGFHINANIYC